MAGEITGQSTNITCKPKLGTTNNEAYWKARVNDGGYFVKVDGATSSDREIGVAFLAENNKSVMGRLIGYTGTGSSKFRVTVETKGIYGTAQGGGTGALVTADYGDRMKADAAKKLVIDAAQTDGNVIVVGGTKAEPIVAWDWLVI